MLCVVIYVSHYQHCVSKSFIEVETIIKKHTTSLIEHKLLQYLTVHNGRCVIYTRHPFQTVHIYYSFSCVSERSISSSMDSLTAFKSRGMSFWVLTTIPVSCSRWFPLEKSRGFPSASQTTPPASARGYCSQLLVISLIVLFVFRNRCHE